MSSPSPRDHLSRPLEFAFTAFASITLYNSIELIILCFATFKRYQGTYFWSVLITSCSLIVNCVGFTLLFFAPITPYFSVTLVLISWYCMITGHSIVLWSRLHLILHKPTLLRAILYLIIVNAIALQIPTTVLLYGAVTPQVESTFLRGYNVIERIQLVVFCLQEVLLSALYIWETAKLLRLRPQPTHRVILTQLLAINVIILVLDVIVVVFQYSGLFALQVVFKPVAYSIKLRLEYAILGRLIETVTGNGTVCNSVRALNEDRPELQGRGGRISGGMVGGSEGSGGEYEGWRRGAGSSASSGP
ncbi:hypothetical protein BJX76DRAFT_348651 [Aspergillus varians]